MQDLYTIEDNSIEVTETVATASTSPSHAALLNRDAPSQHPISAIEGLRAELDKIEELKTVVSNSKGFAQYHMWSDQNPDNDITRIGRFVSLNQEGGIQVYSDGDASILGVVVDETNLANPIGFIGGKPTSDEAIWNATKHRYGLVALLGNVLVRVEEDVKVGDYVLPNNEGIATKSTIGYRVTALSNIEAVPYASINLVPDGQALNRLREQIDALDQGTLQRLEVKTIEQAQDLTDLIDGATNQSFDIAIITEITIDGVNIPQGSGHLIVSALGATMYLVESNGNISVFNYTGTWQRGGTSIPVVNSDIQAYALSLPKDMVAYFATDASTGGLPEGVSEHCTGTIFRRGAADTDQSWIELNDGGSNIQYRCYYDTEVGSWSEWQRSDHVAHAEGATIADSLELFVPSTTQEFMEFLHDENNIDKTFSFTTNSEGEGIALINNYGTENEEKVYTIPAYARGTLTRSMDSALNLVDCHGKHFTAYYTPSQKKWSYGYDQCGKAATLESVNLTSSADLERLIGSDGYGKTYAVSVGGGDQPSGVFITTQNGQVEIPGWSRGILVNNGDSSLNMVDSGGRPFVAFYNHTGKLWDYKYDEVSKATNATNANSAATATRAEYCEYVNLSLVKDLMGSMTDYSGMYCVVIEGKDGDSTVYNTMMIYVRTGCISSVKDPLTNGILTYDPNEEVFVFTGSGKIVHCYLFCRLPEYVN